MYKELIAQLRMDKEMPTWNNPYATREPSAAELEAADAIERLQAELDRVKPPCEVGAIVSGKNGKWSGEVTELSVNSDGWFLYVDYGNGYRGLHRPDEVLFSTRKEG